MSIVSHGLSLKCDICGDCPAMVVFKDSKTSCGMCLDEAEPIKRQENIQKKLSELRGELRSVIANAPADSRVRLVAEIWDLADPKCSAADNLIHTQYVFQGYRDFHCHLGNNPYSPGSARANSWQVGYNMAYEDFRENPP